MRVVSCQSEAEIRRRKTREELAWPLRDLTANLLRITRGGGKPHLLAKQFKSCLNVFAAYADAHQALPSAELIFGILNPDETFLANRPWIEDMRAAARKITNDEDVGQTEREQAMQRIRGGALQAAAAMLLDQLTQKSAGEKTIYEGIRLLDKARATSAAYYANPKRRKLTVDEALGLLKRPKKK